MQTITDLLAPIATLDDLNQQSVWMAWRNELRDGKLTKVPYSPHGGPGKVNDPSTWGKREAADYKAAQIIQEHGGGTGVMLGTDCGDKYNLIGLDLDTCYNATTDIVEDWAIDVIDKWRSYTEISPSNTGVKMFALMRQDDVPRVRELMATQHGRMFKRSGDNHPPAIELHISNRWFAVTGKTLVDDDLAQLQVIEFADIQWLLKEAGPDFVANDPNSPTQHGESDTGNHARTRTNDKSRSGIAFRLGLQMRRELKTFDEFVEIARINPETAEWCRTKGEAKDQRELHRIWDEAGRRIHDDANGISLDDFWAYMPNHTYIYAPTRDHWPAASVNARLRPVVLLDDDGAPVLDDDHKPVKLKPSLWLDQNKPIEQLAWVPGFEEIVTDRLILEGGWKSHLGVTLFNLYHPPTIATGDATKAQMWLDHLQLIYPDNAEHILNWLAHRVQHPEIKINHALVLGGAPGIGKDTLLDPIKHAVGPWNFQEVSPDAVMGQWSGFLKGVIVRINEARDLGEHDRFKFYERIKSYTASPPDVLFVNEKYRPQHYIVNVCGIIYTTNHGTDSLYLPTNDRRHYVTWSTRTKEEPIFTDDYWNKIWNWYNNGGISDIAAYLRARDIRAFDPKAPPPITPEFLAIADANRPPEEGELADVIDELGQPDAFRLDCLISVAITSTGNHELADWLRDRKNRRILPHRLGRCGYTPVRNPDAQDGLWVVKRKRQAIYAKTDLTLAIRITAAQNLLDPDM